MNMCSLLIQSVDIFIRQFAQVIGTLIAAEPGVEYGLLFIKSLELSKNKTLSENQGNFDAKMRLSCENISDLNWWIQNVRNVEKPIFRPDSNIVIKTDSSTTGWGGVMEDTVLQTKGFWSYEDQREHINFLELKAAFLCLKHFCSTKTNSHIKMFLDNMVAVNYINKMGGGIPKLNALTREFWMWCYNRNLWVTACHLPGVANIEADRLSRSLNLDIEWKLNEDVFDLIDELYGPHDVDLFASNLNHQLSHYYSYLPDKYAIAVDAFSVKWSLTNNYCFPPFSLIGKVLKKTQMDQADLTLIAPVWPTQAWFSTLLHMIVEDSYLIPKMNNLLYLPQKPLSKHQLVKMNLGVFRISGKSSKVMDYQMTLPMSSFHHGKDQHGNSIGHISKSGCCFVLKEKLIYLRQLK